MRRVVYSLLLSFVCLFSALFSHSALPDDQSHSLLSQRDISPHIPSIASLSEDPDLPEIMCSGGAPFTKGEMDLKERLTYDHLRKIPEGYNPYDKKITQDKYGYWRTPEGYMVVEYTPPPTKDLPENNMIPIFWNPQVAQPPVQPPPAQLPLPQPTPPAQAPQQHYQWQPPVDLFAPRPSWYAPPPRFNMPSLGTGFSVSARPITYSQTHSPMNNSCEDYKEYHNYYSQLTKNDFAALIVKKYGTINEQAIRELFHNFALFQFPEYCDFIYSLNAADVEDAVMEVYQEIQNDPKLAQALNATQYLPFREMIQDCYRATTYRRTGNLTRVGFANIPLKEFDEKRFNRCEETTQTLIINSQEYYETVRIEREIVPHVEEPEKPAEGWFNKTCAFGKKILSKIPLIRNLVKSQETVTIRTIIHRELHPKPSAIQPSSVLNTATDRNDNVAPLLPSSAPLNAPIDDEKIVSEQLPVESPSVLLPPVASEPKSITTCTPPDNVTQTKTNSPYDSTRAYLAGLPLGPILDQSAAIAQLELLDNECQELLLSHNTIERAPPLTPDERRQLEKMQLTFDDTYQEIIVDATSSWGTALLRRRDALNRTLAGEQFSEKRYYLADEMELLLDDADLERLRAWTGDQLTTELHEELLLVCNRLCTLDPEQIYQPFSLSHIILDSVHYGLETLEKRNLVTTSALANVCWALQDDLFLDLTLTNAYDDLMLKAHKQVEHILNTLESIIAIPEGMGKKVWNIGEWACQQPGLICENPKQYSIDTAKKAWQITQALGILSNTNYEPLCDEYDFSWTGSDIQDRLALNKASNEAWAAAWTAVGKQINKDYNESTPRSRGNALGAYIVDCLIMHSLKPHAVGQGFRMALEEAVLEGELSTLRLTRGDIIRQFCRNRVKETVLESAKISYTKGQFAQFLKEMVQKNPAWFNIPITEETLSNLFTNLVGELKFVPYTAQELARLQLYEYAMAAATTEAEKAACGALLEGIAALPTAAEIGSVLAGPVITAGGQIFVPPSSPIIIPVSPIIPPTAPTIIPATSVAPVAPSVVPPTSGTVLPTGAPSIIVPAGVTPPGSVLMANGQVYTPAATAGVVPAIASPAIQPTAQPITPPAHQTPLVVPLPQPVFQAAPVQSVAPQPTPIQSGLAHPATPPVSSAQPPVNPPAQSSPVGFLQQNQPVPTSDIRKEYIKHINPLMKKTYKFESNPQTLAFIDPALMNLTLTIDVWHLFFAQFKKDVRDGLRLFGMHHDYNNEILPKFGCTLQVIDKFPDGAFMAHVIKNGYTMKDKGFFDPNKTRQEVIDSILEALNNPTVLPHIAQNGEWSIVGKTKSDLVIRMYMTKSGLITSAFPIG